MSLTLKVNFKKGWPSPAIAEKVAQPDSGVTTLEAGKGGHLNPATGAWVLGIATANQQGYVFRNDQGDPDSATITNFGDPLAIGGSYGGIQGISLANPIEFETVQYADTPAPGDEVYCDTDGKFKVAYQASTNNVLVGGKLIVAVVTKGVHQYQNSSYITLVPDNSKRVTSGATGATGA